ncbi:hypothetical protein GF358_03355 [Candidatus Woesearchaeota archaeon]|nr:hypothetical protein [Candidatus Woesearchaeota archaeon]
MFLKYFILGILVKLITGFDDTITHIPVLASLTRKRLGKLAYSIGMMLAIITAVIVAIFLIHLLHAFPYYTYISAGLIFTLAILIFFDILVQKPRKKVEQKLLKKSRISFMRFSSLVGIGFVAALATVIDDVIAYAPVLNGDLINTIFAIMGILLAAVAEIIIIIYFSRKVAKIPYKNKIAGIGLFILGILILTGVI